MIKSLSLFAAVALVISPCIAQPQTIPSNVAAGPQGYDWQIGTWSCTNSMPPTPLGGPSHQTEVVSRINTGVIAFHVTGDNFDLYSYNVYVPAKKKWVGPFAAADGSYGSESTTQSGKKLLWDGAIVDPAGKTTHIRDTFVYGSTSFNDLGESLLSGTWKPQYKLRCTRTKA